MKLGFNYLFMLVLGFWAQDTSSLLQSSNPKQLDTEVGLDTLGIIKRWGYPAEAHNVTTKDGYILTMHRIHLSPHVANKNRSVILMQHGLEGSSADWVTNLPNQSAGFVFANAGFDVWLGNFRGNIYSLAHLEYNSSDTKFWQFSWDEMAQYDLEAMITKILEVTQVDQIYYMGYSQGTLTAFAKFSEDQELASRIKHMYALAPVCYLGHISGAMKYIAPFTKEIDFITKLAGYNRFLPNDKFVKFLAERVCASPILDPVCSNILFLVAGPNTNQLNDTRLPVYLSHTPSGTSTMNVVHFGQNVRSGKFQKYNYGWWRNLMRYKSFYPPQYNVSRMNVPTTLFWGDQDYLADPVDVKYLINNLKHLIGSEELIDFNHLDFIWGLRAAEEVYNPIIDHINLSL